MASVIVFGPTGNVASIAAMTAQEHGAKVYLAMRDTSKTIPGLSQEQEKAGGFERIQADLTKPDTVSAAVKSSGATRAFIYVIHGAPDHMKPSIEALKSSGIELVVFLSSFTIRDRKLEEVPADDLIPFVHAAVELNLDAVYGPENYVALRPGGFATNLLRFKQGIIAGDVKMFGGWFGFDCITPQDMGRVGGTILAKGPREGQTKVYLYGPEIIPQEKCIGIIGEVLGKDIKITDMSPEEATEHFVANGVPKRMADYMVNIMSGSPEDTPSSHAYFETGVKNIELYTGKPSMSLREWLADNKQLFTA